MPLRLVFSWFADAGAWPEHPGVGPASFNSAVVGPMRLLDHLETMLGYGAPVAPGIKRIAIFRRKLECAGSGRFWSESFAADSWATARELLNWRDELIEAGWRKDHPFSSKRLADLVAAEAAGPLLSSGLGDRLRIVIDALGEKPNLPLASIEFVDIREDLPSGWRRLIDSLESCGVTISAHAVAKAQPGERDLSRLLAPYGDDNSRPPIVGDGSVTLLTAGTELIAAEAVAGWLAANPSANEGLVFILGKDSAALDYALRRAGLPRLGASASSPHRALLQVLPLAFALAWNPPDPGTLLDFLLLPVCPLPRWAANRLANCVSASPGVGGPRWQEAFAEIARLHAEKNPDASSEDRDGAIARWREFVEPERHDPASGMSRVTARAIAGRVAHWATSRYASTAEDLFLVLAAAANDLSEAIDATDAEKLDRLLIERMIEQVVGTGVADPSAVAEAAPWRAVTHPGAIWGPARTIIWWHFADNGEINQGQIWDDAEIEELHSSGCDLDEPARAIRRIAASWERPLLFAQDRLLFVRPAQSSGEKLKTHPLWHAVVAGRRGLEERIAFSAEAILRQPTPQFAKRALTRQIVSPTSLSTSRDEWSAQEGAIHPREFESASSLSSLLSCPFKWTLQYEARLRTSARQSLTDGDTLLGVLAHAIAEYLFLPGAPPDPEETVALARKCLEELLPEMGATLLIPGAARELAAARKAIPEALGELARFLGTAKLRIKAMESDFADSGSLGPETGIAGAIDLLAVDQSDRPVVIDLKWQRTDKYRRAEIAHGVAIQLAVYAKHVDPSKQNAATGFYMLRQKRLVTSATEFSGPVVSVEGPSAKETWDEISARWRAALGELQSGKVRAAFEQADTSQEDFADPVLMTPPKCIYCDYQNLCGGV